MNALRGNVNLPHKPRALPGSASRIERVRYKAEKGAVYPRKNKSLLERQVERRQLALANQMPYEKFKHGRYSEYYPRLPIPGYFRSLNGQIALGFFSAPGNLLAIWSRVTGKPIEQLRAAGIKSRPLLSPQKELNKALEEGFDFNVPEIKLIPREDMPSVLLDKLNWFDTPQKRSALDRDPRQKKLLLGIFMENLAAIDWAEKTYGIRVDVPHEILEWIKKK